MEQLTKCYVISTVIYYALISGLRLSETINVIS